MNNELYEDLLKRSAPRIVGDQYTTARPCLRVSDEGKMRKLIEALTKNESWNAVPYKRHVWLDPSKYNADGSKRRAWDRRP